MKNKNLINSFKYALIGIKTSFKSERNMKIHFIISLLVILFGIILKINKYEWIICIFCIALVLSCEMINTSIETTVDLISPNYNLLAKKAKDVSAGAVLICAISAAIIGLIIFIPKIINLI